MSQARMVTLTFEKCIQDSQEYGSDDEHMVSRVFFSLDIDGKVYEGLYADIKQTVGSSFDTGSMEVSRPIGYDGPFNHSVFLQAAEEYYRSLVGSQGSGIRITGGASNVRMMNNTFVKKLTINLPIA